MDQDHVAAAVVALLSAQIALKPSRSPLTRTWAARSWASRVSLAEEWLGMERTTSLDALLESRYWRLSLKRAAEGARLITSSFTLLSVHDG
jgi:hypothetical protein